MLDKNLIKNWLLSPINKNKEEDFEVMEEEDGNIWVKVLSMGLYIYSTPEITVNGFGYDFDQISVLIKLKFGRKYETLVFKRE